MRVHSSLVRLLMPVVFLALFAPAEAYPEPGTSLAAGATIDDPIAADLEQVLKTSTATWRSPQLEVFRWDLFPDVLVVDTRDFHLQDRMFTRLAYFVEKKGFSGTLMTNLQLSGRHGWNAHDYGPDGLASFYNTAHAKMFPLNPEETALESLAIREGILVLQGERAAPGRGAVLSISRSSSAIERRYLLTHESFHGVFFSSLEYREFCFRLWDSLPEVERQFYRGFMDSLGYDSNDRVLTVNEFQAYLMQQPLKYAASYFERSLARFAEQETYGTFKSTDLLETAEKLDTFLHSNLALRAGETVSPVGQDAEGR